jgi:hypothetical protein
MPDQHIYIHKRSRAWIWVVLFLIAAGVAVYFLFLKPKSDDAALQQRIDSLGVEIYIRELQIDSVSDKKDAFVDTLSVVRAENKRLKSSYNTLLKTKEQALVVAKEVPPNVAYKRLDEEIYPDGNPDKPYPFSGEQVRRIYSASIDLTYYSEQVALLGTRLAVREKEIALQDSVILSNEIVLDMKGEIIEDQDRQLEISGVRIKDRDKKIRRRSITGAAIAAGAFIAGMLVGGN